MRIFADFHTVAIESDPFDPGIFYMGRNVGTEPVDLSGIELERAPSEAEPVGSWARKTASYLVGATVLGLRTTGFRDAVEAFRIDYPTRLLRLAGIWEWPS